MNSAKMNQVYIPDSLDSRFCCFWCHEPFDGKVKIEKLAVQRARDNGFNYRVIPIEFRRVEN